MKRFARLWVSAQTAVAAYVFSAIRDTHEAEDVLQLIAEAAVEDFDRYDPQRSFTGWVLGIARHRVLHHLRTRRRDRHVFGDKALMLIAEAHERLDRQGDGRREALSHCLEKLTDRHRRLLNLRYEQAMGPGAIADQMGTSVNAISVALHRVRQGLADCIRRRLDSVETGASHD